jgi:hypothetical protein
MRYIWFICICLTLAIGGFYCNSLRDNPKYIYEPGYYKGHLNTIKKHLQTISAHLQKYNLQNGRYPDNNEGLTVLEDLKKELIGKQKRLLPPMGSDDSGAEYYHRDVGEMASFEGGILSPWFEPFMYENRRNLPANMFVDSPANQDEEQNYSIKVDESIYVYSMKAALYSQEYSLLMKEVERARLSQKIIKIAMIILIIIFVYLFIRAKRSVAKQVWWVKTLKICGSGLVFLTSLIIGGIETRVTCYIMDIFDLGRHPEMISQYTALLDKYRQRGVITDATYQKIKQSLGEVDKLIEDGKIR